MCLLGVILSVILSPSFAQAPSIYPNTDQLIVVEDTTLKASITPCFLALNSVLGALIEKDELDYNQVILLNKIIECESGWRNICNTKSCDYGQGVAQLIPSTIKYCEEKLGKRINPFNINENVECAVWLFNTYGTQPWGNSETWWGSWDCFKHLLY